MTELVFPVIAVSSEGLYAYESEESLGQCRDKALHSGYFDGLLLIDAAGVLRRVTRVVPASRHLFVDRIFNRVLSVRLEMETVGPVSLERAKEMVLERIGADSQFWDSAGDAVGQRILATHTFSEIAAILLS